MLVVRHELMHRDAISVAIGLNQNGGNASGVPHLTRTNRSHLASAMGVIDNRLNVLKAIKNGVFAVHMKFGGYAHSMGTTLTVPAAES